MQKCRLLLVAAAERDFLGLHLFVELSDSPARADKLLGGIEQAMNSFVQMPERGHVPPELARIGIHEVREIHHKP